MTQLAVKQQSAVSQVKSEVQFMHYRSADVTRGGATVAIFPQPDTKTALIGIARCGPKDVFNKKVGRSIAAGRIKAFLSGSPSDYVAQFDVDMDNLKDSVAFLLNDTMAEYGL